MRCAAIAELEGDAAKDQADKHQQHRQVEGPEEHRIGRREGREEARADHHQPGFVAVPERRDAGHHLPALGFVAGGAEKNADADVEAVEDHVDQDGGGDDRSPEQGERARVGHGIPPGCRLAAGGAGGRVGERQRSAGGRIRDRLGRGGRPFAQQLVDVEGAETGEDGIDQHVDGERKEHVAGGQRWRHRIAGAQDAVDDPGLAADLGGVPAAQHGDEPGRKRQERAPTGTSASFPAARASAGGCRARRRRA